MYGNEQDARDGLKPSRASEVLFLARYESGEDKSIAEFVVEITHGIASINNQLSIGRDDGIVEGGMVGRHQHAVETSEVIRGQIDALHLEIVLANAGGFGDVRIAVLDQSASIFKDLDQLKRWLSRVSSTSGL